MKEDKDTRLVEVFTGSPWEAEFTKGLLESNGIESILKDGGGLAALAPYYIGQEIAVLVNEDDYEQAMEIGKRRTNKSPNIFSPPTQTCPSGIPTWERYVLPAPNPSL